MSETSDSRGSLFLHIECDRMISFVAEQPLRLKMFGWGPKKRRVFRKALELLAAEVLLVLDLGQQLKPYIELELGNYTIAGAVLRRGAHCEILVVYFGPTNLYKGFRGLADPDPNARNYPVSDYASYKRDGTREIIEISEPNAGLDSHAAVGIDHGPATSTYIAQIFKPVGLPQSFILAMRSPTAAALAPAGASDETRHDRGGRLILRDRQITTRADNHSDFECRTPAPSISSGIIHSTADTHSTPPASASHRYSAPLSLTCSVMKGGASRIAVRPPA